MRISTILILLFAAFLFACEEGPVVEDSQRRLVSWNPPADFRPSYITQDEDSIYWGLFISKRYSAKYNLWAVKSSDRRNWVDPILIENAYAFSDIDFEVRNDSLHFVVYEINPGYFPDHGLGLGAYVDYKDDISLLYSIKELRKDRDLDKIYDNIEKELLTSDRLPDTDLDGKNDLMDYCPLSKPHPLERNHKVYESVLWNIIQSSGIDKIKVEKDTAWTKYFRTYVLKSPSPLYLAFPKEKETFELKGFPMPLVIVKTPLWFGSRPSYNSLSGGTIPHLNFRAINYNLLKNGAKVYVESYLTEEQIDNYEFHVEKEGGQWVVTASYLLEEKQEEEDTTTSEEANQASPESE